MARLYILSEETLNKLKESETLKKNICHNLYEDASCQFEFGPNELIELKDFSIPDNLCEMMLKKGNDYEAAIYLHEQLGFSPLLAADEQVWAYLTHGPLLEYVKKRWPITDAEDDIKKVNHILDHWFINTHSRMMRNALASLWWSVEISILHDENEEDPYRLTRVLFKNYTLRVVTLVQVLRSRNVLRGILEWFYKNDQEAMEVRGAFIAKYLNQIASIKQLTVLSWEEIVLLIDDVKDVIEGINQRGDYQKVSVTDTIYNIRSNKTLQ